MTPPLQLENYFFKRLLVDAQLPDGEDEPQFEGSPSVTTEIELFPHVEDENRYQLRLFIERDEAEPGPGTYDIELEVYGFFSVSPDWPEEERESIVRVTGASILYGAAREHLLAVTSRGPWPALMLPTTSFVAGKSPR